MDQPRTGPIIVVVLALGIFAAMAYDAVAGTGNDITIAVAFGLGLMMLVTLVAALLKRRTGGRK